MKIIDNLYNFNLTKDAEKRPKSGTNKFTCHSCFFIIHLENFKYERKYFSSCREKVKMFVSIYMRLNCP